MILGCPSQHLPRLAMDQKQSPIPLLLLTEIPQPNHGKLIPFIPKKAEDTAAILHLSRPVWAFAPVPVASSPPVPVAEAAREAASRPRAPAAARASAAEAPQAARRSKPRGALAAWRPAGHPAALLGAPLGGPGAMWRPEGLQAGRANRGAARAKAAEVKEGHRQLNWWQLHLANLFVE